MMSPCDPLRTKSLPTTVTRFSGKPHQLSRYSSKRPGVLLWFNAEFAPRRWSFTIAHELDRSALFLTSYVAAIMALIGFMVLLPGPWTIVAWPIVSLALGQLADKLSSTMLATQTDLIAACAVIRMIGISMQTHAHLGHFSLRAITVTSAAALLYLGMRRRTRALELVQNYIPASYSWVASGLLATLAWYELQSIAVAVAWAIFALVLFELGYGLRRSYLRYQAYALLAATFIRIFFANLNVSTTQFLNPRLYTVAPVIASFLWVLPPCDCRSDRDQARSTCRLYLSMVRDRRDSIAHVLRSPRRLGRDRLGRPGIVAHHHRLGPPPLVVHRTVLLLAVAIRALTFNIFSLRGTRHYSHQFSGLLYWPGLRIHLGHASSRLASAVRTPHGNQTAGFDSLLFRPEQPFFFVPVALLATLLAVQLRAGMITIGWSVLGVVVFLFALAVSERSFRLAGVSLLMLGVTKILCVDLLASPTDRYITLIVMGAALLLVSFLYSRYREFSFGEFL